MMVITSVLNGMELNKPKLVSQVLKIGSCNQCHHITRTQAYKLPLMQGSIWLCDRCLLLYNKMHGLGAEHPEINGKRE